MDFINEEDGPRSEAGCFFRVDHDLLDFFDAAHHRGKFDEAGLRGFGDDLGQGGLTDSGRTPENHGTGIVALDFHPQGLAWAEQVLLANIVLQRARAHAFGERSGPGAPALERAFVGDLAKQTHSLLSRLPALAHGFIEQHAARDGCVQALDGAGKGDGYPRVCLCNPGFG